jgi:hypothetical protein
MISVASFVDGPAELASVLIVNAPASGRLLLDGTVVTDGVVVNRQQLDAGLLVFAPDPDANGSDYARIGFRVDNSLLSGNTAILSIDVAAVNDAPQALVPLANQLAQADSLFSFAVGTQAFRDIDVGDTLSYSATLADGTALPAWLGFDAGSGSFGGTPAQRDAGTLQLRVVTKTPTRVKAAMCRPEATTPITTAATTTRTITAMTGRRATTESAGIRITTTMAG